MKQLLKRDDKHTFQQLRKKRHSLIKLLPLEVYLHCKFWRGYKKNAMKEYALTFSTVSKWCNLLKRSHTCVDDDIRNVRAKLLPKKIVIDS